MKSQDLCEKVTAAIIAELETGVMPWSKPWAGRTGGPVMPRRHAGARYRGINVLILWGAAEAAGYRSPHWMTFKQALEYGACVKKGEKSTQIVFTNKIMRSEVNDTGETVDRNFSFLKAYSVFNAEQIDKLPAQFAIPAPAPEPTPDASGRLKDWAAYATSQAWFDAIPAQVIHKGERACFIPSLDRIELPEPDAFFTPEAYFSARAHETVHWTKTEKRLNRDFGAARFGDEGYAMEELVAELGAAFTMAQLGHQPAIREDHAPYIAVWLKVLKRDSKAILTAAAKASDALDYLEWFAAQPNSPPNAQAAELAEAEAA